ncbi:MAG TPA: iron ABC transporter permease [Thermoanaerobaculia bacterium]|nr:iron ABC transporter permease [Thermoanaerobaculia bacterium]
MAERRRARLTAPLLAVALAWLVGYPLLLVVLEALRPAGEWSLGAFARFAARRDEWQALWRTVWISLASVAAAGAVGTPLGFLFARSRFPGRRALTALLTLPVALPPLVGVIAFLFLYGESGLLARLLMDALGLAAAPWELRGAWAILLVHAYSMYVYFFLFVRAALLRADPSMEEAAASLGAGRLRTFFAVTLPALRPALTAASLLAFLTSIASFSAPYIFGGNFRVMTTQIVASKLNGNLPQAMAESVVLALLALLALAASQPLQGRARLASVAHGVTPQRAPRLRGWRQGAVTAAAWALAALLLLPHATLLLLSLVPWGTWTIEALPPVLDFSNYRRLVAEPEALRPVLNSLWMAGLASALALALGFAAARAAALRGGRLGRLLEGLVALPWAVPGTVFAIALAVAFSVDAPALGRVLLVGTPWLLPLAYLLRALPLTGRAAVAGMRQLDPALEEAAASLGAGRLRTLGRVVLPLLWPVLAAGLSVAFVTALGDFVTSILLYTYDNRPIAIEILSNLRLQETGLAAAYGVLLMVLSAAALLAWGEGREVRS